MSNPRELLREASDTLTLEEREIFRRAYSWYHGAIGTPSGTKQYLDFERTGEIPHFVSAYCQEVIRVGRRAQYALAY